MRSDRDRRPARLFKPEALRNISRRGTVEIVVDDDVAVVTALRSQGYAVLHASWMPSEPDAQQSLFEAQEVEGRS
jgi:hypothetical protein